MAGKKPIPKWNDVRADRAAKEADRLNASVDVSDPNVITHIISMVSGLPETHAPMNPADRAAKESIERSTGRPATPEEAKFHTIQPRDTDSQQNKDTVGIGSDVTPIDAGSDVEQPYPEETEYGISSDPEGTQSSRLPPGGRPSSPVAPPVQDAIPGVGQKVVEGIANPGPGEISSTLWGVPKAAAAGGAEAAGAAAAGGATAGAAAGGAAAGAAAGSVVPGIGTIIGAGVGAAAAGAAVSPSPVPGSANAGAAASFRDLGSAAGYAFGSAGGPLGSSIGMSVGGLAGKLLGGGEVTGAEIGKSALSIAGGSLGGKAGGMIGSAVGGLFGGGESGGGSGGGGGATTISGSSDGDSSLMTRLLREISINIRSMCNDGIVIRGDHRQGGSKM